MGWSEASTPANRATAAQDLHRLLTAAGERGPYVLVGASRGGLLVRVYQAEYPAEVAGLVFVDPSSEDRLFTMIAGEARLIADVTAEQMRSTAPNRTIAVPRRSPQMGTPFDRLPPDLYQTRIRLDEKQIAALPDSVPPEIIVTSNENERALLARLRAARNANKQPLGDRPVVVLTRGDDKNADREAVHAAIAQLSTNSRHTVVADAGHEIHLFNPPVVAQAIADVVDAIRTSRPLPRR
jgi:pimeloyl-ACP methyl ester carboxylesterase